MRALGLTLLSAALALPAARAGADWRLSAGVEGGLQAIDERRDAGADTGDVVLSVAPFARARRDGPRLTFGADVEARYRRSLDSGDEDVESGVGAGVGAVLVERTLRFDASAASRLRDTSPVATGRAVGIGASGARVDPARGVDDRRFARVDSLELGPSLSVRPSERTLLDAAYRYGVDRTDGTDAPDGIERHSIDLDARGWLDAARRTSLDFAAEADRATADGGARATSSAASVRLVRVLGPELAAGAVVGLDRVRIDSGTAGAGDADESGTVYGISLAWRPLRRVTALASWLERSFGASPAASLRIAGRRSAVTLDWRRELAFDRGVDLDDAGRGAGAALDPVPRPAPGSREDDAGAGTMPSSDALAGGEGDRVPADPAALFARDLSSVEERVSIGYTLRGRRTDLAVELAHLRREPILGGASVRGTRLGLGATRALGRRASLALDASHGIDDEGGTVRRTRVGLRLGIELR